MSGLFCAEPEFMYRSPNDMFMLEIFHDGKMQLLNFANGTTTTFDDKRVLIELEELMFAVQADQERRERNTCDGCQEFRLEVHPYVKQNSDGEEYKQFCLNCENECFETNGYLPVEPITNDCPF